MKKRDKKNWESVCKNGVQFQYLVNRNRIKATIAFAKNGDGTYSYGLAILHHSMDQCDKELGRQIAYGRMVTAINERVPGVPITHSIFTNFDESIKVFEYDGIATFQELTAISSAFNFSEDREWFFHNWPEVEKR